MKPILKEPSSSRDGAFNSPNSSAQTLQTVAQPDQSTVNAETGSEQGKSVQNSRRLQFVEGFPERVAEFLKGVEKLPKRVEKILKGSVAAWAYVVKTILQMLIGIIMVIAVLSGLYGDFNMWLSGETQGLSQSPILQIVASALLYASAIELAYTLFTPGPDEAVDPLITGIAAIILLSVAKLNLDNPSEASDLMGIVAVLVIVLAALFLIRKFFLNKKPE